MFPAFLDDISVRQKTRNLLKPSRHHFEKLFKKHQYNAQIQDKIYNSLSQRYDANEIEIYCSKKQILHEHSVKEVPELILFNVLDSHFVYHTESKKVWAFETTKEAFNLFQEELQKIIHRKKNEMISQYKLLTKKKKPV